MMKELVKILRDGDLDRETKLRVIEIVSMSQDEQLVKDLVAVLQQWAAADDKMEEDIASSIAHVEEKYQKVIVNLEERREKELEQLEEEVEKEDNISGLKKSILEN